ncbi:DUF3572 family protein [Qipengyuania citrea]|uniref:DUF3572 family protein n=1 Tax=Qipengyuania citrea TaxID=225971 RepID=UPI003D657AE8
MRPPEVLALEALGWALADDKRAERLLSLTGLTPRIALRAFRFRLRRLARLLGCRDGDGKCRDHRLLDPGDGAGRKRPCKQVEQSQVDHRDQRDQPGVQALPGLGITGCGFGHRPLMAKPPHRVQRPHEKGRPSEEDRPDLVRRCLAGCADRLSSRR